MAVFLAGIGLDLIGLQGNTDEAGPIAAQSDATLLGLRLMMTILPMIVLFVALLLFRKKFKLTDERVTQIAEELKQKEHINE